MCNYPLFRSLWTCWSGKFSFQYWEVMVDTITPEFSKAMTLGPFTMTKHLFGSPIISSGMPDVIPTCLSSWWIPADLDALFVDFLFLGPDVYALKGVLFCPFTNFILGLSVIASVGPTVSQDASSSFHVDCCPQFLVWLEETIVA